MEINFSTEYQFSYKWLGGKSLFHVFPRTQLNPFPCRITSNYIYYINNPVTTQYLPPKYCWLETQIRKLKYSVVVLQLGVCVCVLQSDTHFYTQPIEPECHSSTATHKLFQIRATITTDISRRGGLDRGSGWTSVLFSSSFFITASPLPPPPSPLSLLWRLCPICLHVCVCVLGLRRKGWMFRDSCCVVML